MSSAILEQKQHEIQSMIEEVGKALPSYKRIKGHRKTQINLVPTGEIKIDGFKDTFVKGPVDANNNNLENKKVVIIFGRYSHELTRNFLIPKMAMIYHYLTLARNDVEFLYVSLPDESQQDFDKFAAIQRKYYRMRLLGFLAASCAKESFVNAFFNVIVFSLVQHGQWYRGRKRKYAKSCPNCFMILCARHTTVPVSPSLIRPRKPSHLSLPVMQNLKSGVRTMKLERISPGKYRRQKIVARLERRCVCAPSCEKK